MKQNQIIITKSGLIVAEKGACIGRWKLGQILSTEVVRFTLWDKSYAMPLCAGWRRLVRAIASKPN